LFFVDLPSAPERREIISLYASKHLHREVQPQLLDELVQMSEGFAGADLQAAISDMGKEAALKGDVAVDAEYMRRYSATLFPC
jgi:hypothetical protein